MRWYDYCPYFIHERAQRQAICAMSVKMLVYRREADIKEDCQAGGHCKGLVYSSQGLVYSSLGLVYSDRTIGFSGLAEYMFYNLSSQQRPFRERLFTTRGIFWGMWFENAKTDRLPTTSMFSCQPLQNANVLKWNWKKKLLWSSKIYFPIMTSANVSLMGQFSVKAPWIGLNRASDSRVGSSTWLFVS